MSHLGTLLKWLVRWARGREARDVAPLVSLLVLAVFFSIAARGFLQPSTLILIVQSNSVLAIVAVGLTFVLLCAEIDLAVGFLALWSACFCGWLFECPFAAGQGGTGEAADGAIAATIILPLATVLLLGLVSGLLTTWARLPSFIITLAMMNIAYGMSLYLTKGGNYKVPELLNTLGNRGIRLGGSFELPYSTLLAAGVMIAAHLVLQHSRFGRYVYMTGGNRQAARLAGVRTELVVIGCLAISAACAGVGGLLNAGRMGSVTMQQNQDLLLSSVACVVLGGTSLFGGEGSIFKTLVGVMTMGVLTVGLNKIDWIDSHARSLLLGLVLMIALVINGVLAKRR